MNGELWGAFLRLLIALPLTLLLAYGALRFALPRRFPLATGRRMRLVEQLPLGPKAGLWLVQVGDRYYLVAHQEGAVTVVREYEELPPALPEAAGPAAPALARWRDVFTRRQAAGRLAHLLLSGGCRWRRRPPAGTEERPHAR